MSDEIAALRAEIAEYKQQLDEVRSQLKDDPDSSVHLELKTSLEELVAAQESELESLLALQPPAPPPDKEKWSRDKHPAFQSDFRQVGSASEDTAPAAPVTYKVKDLVMAQWISGDKGYYPARIDSVTGSSANPVFIVTFRDYDTSETLRSHNIKSMPQANKKRMADGTPAVPAPPPPPPPPPTTSNDANVISAAANINPDLANQAKREPSKASDGPVRPAMIPKKVKSKTEYESGKSKWEQFQAKSHKSGKSSKKESMFRTGEGVNARVGFVGSGQAMRKDPKRTRHVYDQVDDDEL